MTSIARFATLALTVLALPAFADGDPDKGERGFNKCKACHSITADNGDVIVKGGRVGPNLYGLFGRTAGTVEDYSYSESLVQAGQQGLVWDETNLVEYAADPREFLRTYLDDPKAKSKMAIKVNRGVDDIAAYIASVGPQG
ncbi:c-type cytochrome [Chachezhania antarctica]|uniref:c-type cytochrome n=1 Tax=Chachezhania antarctica TaxID=2340860 RepID=UPI000EB48285|nr:c-type cytochrome [Chachezhania antarctica]|tara:strand:- start:1643 stop:2065 length:423 start_codon:yes stop_codon:yes gene_type:complete